MRPRLFLQRNVIQFSEDLQEEAPASPGAAEAGRVRPQQSRSGRTISFATPWNPHATAEQRRNSMELARDVLSGRAEEGYGAAAPGGDMGFMSRMSFRAGAVMGTPRKPSMAGGGADGYYGGAGGAAGGYSYDVRPPNWDTAPANGLWEIPVAPMPPSIPERLPQWAQREEQQYEQQYQYGATAGGYFARPELGADGLPRGPVLYNTTL